MARDFTCGHEFQSLTAGMEITAITGAGQTINTTTKRSGGASYKVVSSNAASRYVERTYNASDVVSYARGYFYFTAFPTDTTGAILALINSGGSECGSIAITTAGKLQLYDGNIAGTQRGSDSSALSLNTWYGVELAVNNGGATELEARLWQDGVTTPSVFASGAMTVAGNANVIYWGMIDWVAGCTMYVDDIAVNDNSGTAQTSYPGEGKLVIALPTGAGDNAATKGTFDFINEIPPSNTATSGSTMIELDSNGVIGEYAMTDSSTLGIDSYDVITLVEVCARIREEAAGASSYNLRIKSASGGATTTTSNVDGGNATVRTNPTGTTAFTNRLVSYTDPTTGVAWTPTGANSIDSMQCGVGNADADSTPDLWCLWLGAYIEYTEGTPPAGGTIKDIISCNGLLLPR
jgi:hypothetical protein